MPKMTTSRRGFLKIATAAASGSVLAVCTPPTAPPTVPQATAVPTKAAAATAIPPTAAAAPVKVTWMNWGGAERFKPILDAFDATFPDAKQRFNVEVVSGGDSDAQVNEKIRLAMAAGGEGLPDLVTMNYSSFPEFASKGILTDLTGLLDPAALDDMLPAARQMVTYDGKVVGVPMQLNGKVWYYRKDLFEGAGIDPNAIKTFDDFMEAGRKLDENYPGTKIINLGPQPIHYWYFMILSHWADVKVADPSGKYYVAEDPHFRTLFEWLKTWYDSPYTFKTDDWSQDWQPALAEGKIASLLIGTWMSEFLPQFAPDQAGKWDAVLWPEFNRFGSEAGGGLVGIPQGAKNPELGLEFLTKRFLDKRGAAAAWKIVPLAPVIQSGVDEVRGLVKNLTRPDDISDADWALAPVNYYGPGFMEPAFKSMDVFRVPPFDPFAQAELAILRQHAEALLAGQEDIDKALGGAQKDMETQIGNPYQK